MKGKNILLFVVSLVMILSMTLVAACGGTASKPTPTPTAARPTPTPTLADTTAPMVNSTINANGAKYVLVNTKVGAFFTEAMNPLTLTTTTFTLKQGTKPVSGTVTCVGVAAVFAPANNLALGTVYTATITTGAKDLAGNALASDYTWSFKTSDGGSGGGGGGGGGIPVSSSAKAITVFDFATPSVTGVINETDKTVALTVPFGTNVTALASTITVTGASVAPLSGVAQNFTSPVSYTVTAADATTQGYIVTVTVASSSAKAITVFNFATPSVTGVINETAKTIALTVPFGTNVTALVPTITITGASVAPLSGVAQNFTSPVSYTVTAADATTQGYMVTVTVELAANPTAPVLGEAARFVILASQKVTTTGVTAVSNGDIGIEDQARTYYEGFTAGGTPGQFIELTNGLSYAHDDTDPALIPAPYASTIAFINQVRTDLGIAYSYLAADPNPGAPTQVCPIELGGQTLTRGVYKTAENVIIEQGDLHLDAQGDPTSVWIFSIDGTLTTGAPYGNIVLEGGALANNVYWRVAGITVIGANTAFYGNVFSWEQVNMLSGASITGRLFSVNEQVTLIANAVTKAP